MPEGLATGGGNDVALSARTARKRVRVSVAVLIAVALLCAAPSAYAAQRYAAPSPSGAADCSSPSNLKLRAAQHSIISAISIRTPATTASGNTISSTLIALLAFPPSPRLM